MTDYKYNDKVVCEKAGNAAEEDIDCIFLSIHPFYVDKCVLCHDELGVFVADIDHIKPKPKTRIINIIEVPAPITSAEIGDHVHTFSILTEDSTVSVIYQDSDADRLALKQGLFFASADDVIKNINAINANN